VVLQQTVLATEVAIAESAVSNDSLSPFFAVFVCATNLLWGHSAAERHGEEEGRFAVDVALGEGTGRGQVLASVDQP